MTPPANLNALRVLVESVGRVVSLLRSGLPRGIGRAGLASLLSDALPAAQAELERVEQTYAQHVCTHCGYVTVTQPLSVETLTARLTRLEEALRDTLEIVRCQAPDIYEALDVAGTALEGHEEGA